MKQALWAFWLLAILLYQGAYAQTCTSTLYGRVIDEHDGMPLGYATVFIKGTQLGAASDSVGNYRITGVCPGTYQVSCSHLNCETLVEEVKISGNTLHNFYPEHHQLELKGIEISAEKRSVDPRRSTVITGENLTKMQGKNIGETMAQLQGVNLISTGNNIAKPVINGLHSNRVLMINQGIRQEGQQWGTDHAPEAEIAFQDQVSLLSPSEALQYGTDAIGGAISLKSSLPDSVFYGVASTGFNSNNRQGNLSAGVGGKVGEALRYRGQMAAKRSGTYRAPDYFVANTGNRELSYQGNLEYYFRKGMVKAMHSGFYSNPGIYSGSHVGNLTDLNNAIQATKPLITSGFTYTILPPEQAVRHNNVSLETAIKFFEDTLVFTYQFQENHREEFDPDKGSEKPALEFNLLTQTADVHLERTRGNNKHKLGLAGNFQGNTYRGSFFIPQFRTRQWGGYYIGEFSREHVTTRLAGRLDIRNNEVFIRTPDLVRKDVYQYFMAGLAAGQSRYYKHVTLSWDAGFAARPPHVAEQYSNGVHHGSASVEIGTKDLKSEKSFFAQTTLQYYKGKWNVEINPNLKFIQDFIFLEPVLPATLTIRGAFPTFRYTGIDAWMHGINGAVHYNFTTQVSADVKGNAVRAKNIKSKEFIPLMPPDNVTFGLEANPLSGYNIRLECRAVARQTRISGEDYAPAPEAYQLINFEAGRIFQVAGKDVRAFFRVENILNKRYRDYLNRLRYFADNPGRNFQFLVTLNL